MPETQKEAARRLGVHVNTVSNMLHDGRLAAIEVGSGAFRAPIRRVETGSLEQLERSRDTEHGDQRREV